MNNSIFNLQDVGVYYRKSATLPWKKNKYWALSNVSFQIFKGEKIGIIGRNGAGKSTLLKILAGIIVPDTGTIERARVNVTMQSLGAGFDQRLTGRQNIYLNGLLLGMSRNMIQKRVEDIVGLADIGEFIDEPISNYSSGMRSRLGFSIAFYVDTDVILIDEALATGDQAFKKKALELMKNKIKREYTVVIVTHSMDTIKSLCDRVVQIENGTSLPELPVEQSVVRYLSS